MLGESPARVIILEDDKGLIFVSPLAIASLTPDHGQRWRAVLADGTVAHRPEAPPAGPWARLGEAFVTPQHLTETEQGWQDRAGFLLGRGKLRKVKPPPADPPIPGLPCGMDQVFGIESEVEDCIWHTSQGEFRWEEPAAQVAERFPQFVLVVRGYWVNPQRLGRIQPEAETEGRRFLIYSDTGKLLTTIQRSTHHEVAQRFGLPHFYCLEPRNEALSRWRLRDWPVELASAKADFLKEHFQEPAILIMNVVWQAVRQRFKGSPYPYADDYRGFYYDTLYATLYRAGFMLRFLKTPASEDELYVLFQRLVAQAVGEDRLFTFEEMGLADPREHLLSLGTTHPEIVVVAEKNMLAEHLEVLREKYGVTTVITGGQARLLSSEYLAKALKAKVGGPVRIIAYVDYDAAGWLIAKTLVSMLERFGVVFSQPVRYLVRAHHFTAEEIELFSLPLPSKTPKVNQSWLEESGGIGGRPLGIHCGRLKPVQRVLAAFEEALN